MDVCNISIISANLPAVNKLVAVLFLVDVADEIWQFYAPEQ